MKNMMKGNSSEGDRIMKELHKLEFDKRTEEMQLEVFLRSKESKTVTKLIHESQKRMKILENLIQTLNHKVIQDE